LALTFSFLFIYNFLFSFSFSKPNNLLLQLLPREFDEVFYSGITPVVKSRLGTTTVVAGYAPNIVGVKYELA